MNFDKVLIWITGAVVAASITGQLAKLQAQIWKAQAQVLRESRTSTWGSPRFFQKIR